MACQDMERALCPSFLYAVLLSLILGLTLLPPKPRNVAIDAIPSSDNSSVFAGRVCLLPPSSYSPLIINKSSGVGGTKAINCGQFRCNLHYRICGPTFQTNVADTRNDQQEAVGRPVLRPLQLTTPRSHQTYRDPPLSSLFSTTAFHILFCIPSH